MSILKDWLLSVTAAALALALAQALTPEGTVKKIGALIGGMILLLVLVKPVMAIDLEDLADWTARYIPQTEIEPDQGEQMMKSLIAQKTSAYIVDKGAALGCDCRVTVTVVTDESGWPVPWAAEITGSFTPEQRAALEEVLAQELGIPQARQTFTEVGP